MSTLETLTAAVATYQKAAEQGFAALQTRVVAAETKAEGARTTALEAAKVALRPTRGGGGTGDEHERKARAAFSDFIRAGGPGKFATDESKAMSVGEDPAGGYSVEATISSNITRRIFELSPFRKLCRVETIDRSDAFEELIDATELDAQWISETAARPETAAPSLGLMRVPASELYAAPMLTQKLIEDSRIDIANWLTGKLASKFARAEEAAFMTGNGISKPRGLLDYPTAATADATRAWGTVEHIPTGVSGDFHATAPLDALIACTYSVKNDHRTRASWLMPRDAARRLRQTKDLEGRYAWQMSAALGQPDTLLGFPVAFCEAMPQLAANSLSIAFGDFSTAYLIVDRLALSILRDPYSNKPYVSFYSYRRVGGGLANSEAVKLIKFAAS